MKMLSQAAITKRPGMKNAQTSCHQRHPTTVYGQMSKSTLKSHHMSGSCLNSLVAFALSRLPGALAGDAVAAHADGRHGPNGVEDLVKHRLSRIVGGVAN